MKKFSNVVLFILFATVIFGSFQPVFSEDELKSTKDIKKMLEELGEPLNEKQKKTLDDMFKVLPIKNSEYQFHLQVVQRDGDSELINVIESTNGYYIAHEITDQAFDSCFGSNTCKKEIVTLENKNYEKIQLKQNYSLKAHTAFMFLIMIEVNVTDNNKVLIADAPIFQAFVPVVYLADDNQIYTQWTILREIN